MGKFNDDSETARALALERQFVARNYAPLPVVICRAEGSWVEDVDGNRYLDCLAGYSALNFGHRNPRLLAAAERQMGRVTMTSRAFCNDQLGQFAKELVELADAEMMLPMNTGAEAVETAIKVARAWGYRRKGVPAGLANIIVMSQNFHGRTTTIISFSDDPVARTDFGPFTPGFRTATFGDADSVRALIDENTVAVLAEPIQGEAGVVVPPADFFPRLRELCDANEVLLIADEIQSGLGRAGHTFACQLWDVKPDLYVLGKALGGGILPVSAVVGSEEVLGVFNPGEHGSTFGGNPLSAAVGLEVVRLLQDGTIQWRAQELGAHLAQRLTPLVGQGITGFTQVGLWSGIAVDPQLGTGRELCERLATRGVLAKDTHGSTVRLSPPLTISAEELDFVTDRLAEVLSEWKNLG